ncbi:hypothetical protein Tco_0737369, partial [Tanacetum coccineum]
GVVAVVGGVMLVTAGWRGSGGLAVVMAWQWWGGGSAWRRVVVGIG